MNRSFNLGPGDWLVDQNGQIAVDRREGGEGGCGAFRRPRRECVGDALGCEFDFRGDQRTIVAVSLGDARIDQAEGAD